MKYKLLGIAIIIYLFYVPTINADTGATIGTSTTFQANSNLNQQKGFYGKGLFWQFYCNGATGGFETSNDGVNWTGSFTSIGTAQAGSYFSIWYDEVNDYVYYARWANYDLYYRRGIPRVNGTITWSNSEQMVYDGTSTNSHLYPSITVDTNGHVWIGTVKIGSGTWTPYTLQNNNTDGTWSLNATYQLSTTASTQWRTCIKPLPDGKMYVVYAYSAGTPRGRLYIKSWQAEESNLGDYAVETSAMFDVIADGNNIHFVYTRDVTYQILYNNRTYGVGWLANDVLVQDNVGSQVAGTLSLDAYTGEVYCFYVYNTDEHGYYKVFDGEWDINPTDWFNETVDLISLAFSINSYYTDFGNVIGFSYVTKASSPYAIKFVFLNVTPPYVPLIKIPSKLFGGGFNESGYVYLMWVHDTGEVDNYEIQHSTDNITYIHLAYVNETYYNHTSLVDGSYHYYKIRSTFFNMGSWYNSSYSPINLERVYFPHRSITYVDGSWYEYNVSTITIVKGVYDSGNLSSMIVDDADYYIVDEVAGVEGFDIRTNFTNIPLDILSLSFRALTLYHGNPAHVIAMEVFNHSSNTWLDLNHIAVQDTFVWTNHSLSVGSGINNAGNVWCRIVHYTSGVGTHYEYLDYVKLRGFIAIPSTGGGIVWWLGLLFISIPLLIVLLKVLRK